MVNQENFWFIQTLKVELRHKQLRFRKPAKTSRDVLTVRDIYFILLIDESTGKTGIGECAPLKGLSIEIGGAYLDNLKNTCSKTIMFEDWQSILTSHPSILFGFETALLDLKNEGERNIFPSDQCITIPINGLVWMSEKEQMLNEAFQKIEAGYKCIKLKIGGIDFVEELSILKEIRKNFPPEKLTIRIDANGAFSIEEANKKLDVLSQFDIHSIEQPIKAGNRDFMALLVTQSPIKIALDEELIGEYDHKEKVKLLETILPNYIILKPTLHGGICGSNEWIEIATSLGIDWWATSALESNIGLNAISQWVATKNPILEQGLGTGMLFENNIPSPITIESGQLTYDPLKNWDISEIYDQNSLIL